MLKFEVVEVSTIEISIIMDLVDLRCFYIRERPARFGLQTRNDTRSKSVPDQALWLDVLILSWRSSLACVYHHGTNLSSPPTRCAVFSWVTPGRLEAPSLHMTGNPVESQSYRSCLPFFWLAYLKKVLIRSTGKRLYIQPYCQRGEIYLSTSNGRWQEEGKYGQRSATFNETVMSGGVRDKKKTNQTGQTVTLKSPASSTCR